MNFASSRNVFVETVLKYVDWVGRTYGENLVHHISATKPRVTNCTTYCLELREVTGMIAGESLR
jgi:hypothetical protein